MRALFLIPGGSSQQLQSFAAVAAVADQLGAEVQVVCPLAAVPLWGLHPAVNRAMPFAYDQATLADWANLMGSVREPDFQLCINLAPSRQMDLMLSMSHIPTRVAAAGFSATERITPAPGGWPNQALEAFLRPIGLRLDADTFRLPLAQADLEAAAAALPAGDGPVLLLAPSGGAGDWPADQWAGLPAAIRSKLPNLRTLPALPASAKLRGRAAQVASADVVLASDPVAIELALLLGLPLVALGREAASLPSRAGVQGLGTATNLAQLGAPEVLAALGLG
ncbi:lipopolysaccharide heptosyltransferase family protein [Cyanobium sp. FACHB-13342]|uniref:glycosyltransferase family 9 protein n=1 Tax=Cyanobium sp. FACHB-13342 TaxID=2692793 RepID=UPI0016804C35|nr:lipopolysaccharide heptosyltransferase family protein [Cyanobium sp. FACHB-13342]MBD2422649.1 lipopolysaccharide heptosyltransferase family protein [Cyanobium sp. FACHB-13342]